MAVRKAKGDWRRAPTERKDELFTTMTDLKTNAENQWRLLTNGPKHKHRSRNAAGKQSERDLRKLVQYPRCPENGLDGKMEMIKWRSVGA